METFTVPEKVRLQLVALNQQVQIAQQALNVALTTALNWGGLDPANPNHAIDLEKGIITPAPAAPAAEPTPIRAVEPEAEALN